jgi:hypothetical protein
MTEAEARRARNTPSSPPSSVTGGSAASDSSNDGLALSGRDIKYMAVGVLLFTIALVIGIKTLIPTQQIVKTVAAVAK